MTEHNPHNVEASPPGDILLTPAEVETRYGGKLTIDTLRKWYGEETGHGRAAKQDTEGVAPASSVVVAPNGDQHG